MQLKNGIKKKVLLKRSPLLLSICLLGSISGLALLTPVNSMAQSINTNAQVLNSNNVNQVPSSLQSSQGNRINSTQNNNLPDITSNALNSAKSTEAKQEVQTPSKKQTIIEQTINSLQSNDPGKLIIQSSKELAAGTSEGVSDSLHTNNVGVGNATEAELTPRLREVANKKASLELLKLETEIQRQKIELAKGVGEYLEIIGAVPAKEKKTDVPAQPMPVVDPYNINHINGQIGQREVKKVHNGISIKKIFGFQDQLRVNLVVNKNNTEQSMILKQGDKIPGVGKVESINRFYVSLKLKDGETKEFFVEKDADSSNGNNRNNMNNQMYGGPFNGNQMMNNVPVMNPVPQPIPAPVSMPNPQTNG